MEDERKDTVKSLESNPSFRGNNHIVIYPLIYLKLKVCILLKTTFVILELSFQTLVCIHSDIHMKALIVIRMK